jgi:hypothetical protein
MDCHQGLLSGVEGVLFEHLVSSDGDERALVHSRILYEKRFNLKLPADEVYCTNA